MKSLIELLKPSKLNFNCDRIKWYMSNLFKTKFKQIVHCSLMIGLKQLCSIIRVKCNCISNKISNNNLSLCIEKDADVCVKLSQGSLDCISWNTLWIFFCEKLGHLTLRGWIERNEGEVLNPWCNMLIVEIKHLKDNVV